MENKKEKKLARKQKIKRYKIINAKTTPKKNYKEKNKKYYKLNQKKIRVARLKRIEKEEVENKKKGARGWLKIKARRLLDETKVTNIQPIKLIVRG